MSRLRLRVLLACAVGALLAGCKSQCQQLSEKLCDCATNSTLKASCLQRAATEASNIGSNAQQDATCKALMNQCDCHIIDTPEGKVACGLARSAGAGGN